MTSMAAWSSASVGPGPYRDAIRQLLARYGSKCAADLELLSTIVYTDREASMRPIFPRTFRLTP